MGDVLLPILRDSKDAFYRYKMPQLCAKVEGSGNGIKTVITNMAAIGKALNRSPAYITKYFGCELGTQVKMNTDFTVNGAHDREKLLNLLYDFIKKFVLCQNCKNPETSLTIVNKTIHQKCIACGHLTTMSKTYHKLTTFILNNPPETGAPATGTAAAGKTTSKSSSAHVEKGKSKSKSKTANTSDDGSNSPTGGGDSNGHGPVEDKFDDTFDDFEEAADPRDCANAFYQLVSEKKAAGQLQVPGVQVELVKEAERLRIKDKAVLILAELLFTEQIMAEIKTHKLLLLRFCLENKRAQKYLLGGVEKLVGIVHKETLLNAPANQVAKILKQFYDEDVLTEEVLIDWAKKQASKKYVSKDISKLIHEKAEPFIKWLKEAEVEEDSDEEEEEETTTKTSAALQKPNLTEDNEDEDDEDEDDGLGVEFTHRFQGVQLEAVKPSAPVKAVNADVQAAADSGAGDEEEIDIDNI